MNNRILLMGLIVLIINVQGRSERKSIEARRIYNAPTIDGILDEDVWMTASVANDFVMYRPGNGDKEPNDLKTVVKIIYDDKGIYFGAYLYDSSPDLIPREYGSRNAFTQSDFFGIILNPFDDQVTEMEFFVMSTGVQADAISIEDAEDENWNQVWESAVTFVDDGWIVEVKIPYSAIRFSGQKTQNWGVNFHRRIRRTNEQYSWNYIDKSKGFRSQQAGLLTGLQNLNPPVRLSLSPFTFFSVQNEEKITTSKFSVGLDLKYGISDSYTLDATLIPEFGQTTFDKDQLILSPFEQQFAENRSFFKEGIDLFSIGDLFYSRRVGNTPLIFSAIPNNKIVQEVPKRTSLINALKLSGRNNKGLGIGIFNGITQKGYATLRDVDTGKLEELLISPLTNYNVIVLDQQFNKNSSISIVNTNVLRTGHFSDANVSALVLNLMNSKNYIAKATAKYSIIRNDIRDIKGFSSEAVIGKNSGKYQFEYYVQLTDAKFDNNDLGFQLRNNYHNNGVAFAYEMFEPNNYFNSMKISVNTELNFLYKPAIYTGNIIRVSAEAFTRGQVYVFAQIGGNLGNQRDYFYKSLIVDDTFIIRPTQLDVRGTIRTDTRKKISLLFNGSYFRRSKSNTYGFRVNFNPNFRFSNRFIVNYNFDYSKRYNERGYTNADVLGKNIIGIRNVKTISNSIQSTYFISKKALVEMSIRHLWSPVTYNDVYYTLDPNGSLLRDSYKNNHNINFNSWNANISFSWEFAPGSQLVAQYRNNISSRNNNLDRGFSNNLAELFKEPSITNTSIKLLYYLDVTSLRKTKIQ